MKQPTQQQTPIQRQHGITLIEALVALVVTALGLFGILGLQMRTLADAQTGVRQAQAIRLVENLSERVRMNPNATSAQVAANYIVDWGTAPNPPDCSTGCSAEQRAKTDVLQWKRLLQGTASASGSLPLADAKVFFVGDEQGVLAGNRRQLGVMISWRENEAAQNAGDDSYLRYFRLTSSDNSREDVNCPAGRTCYLQFIQLASRCVANLDAGQPRYYCADGSALEIKAAPTPP